MHEEPKEHGEGCGPLRLATGWLGVSGFWVGQACVSIVSLCEWFCNLLNLKVLRTIGHQIERLQKGLLNSCSFVLLANVS